MNYAIIAAGEGSRLREEGLSVPKPLVTIAGQSMLGRLIGIFQANDADSISVILRQEIDIPSVTNVIYAATPSSMHSLYKLSSVIPEDMVVVTTVDTIFSSTDFAKYIAQCKELAPGEALFAVTPYVDDEKPLWVSVSKSVDTEDKKHETLYVTGFYDSETELPSHSPRLVSGGIYCMDTHTAWPVLQACYDKGIHRMRNFQRALIESGVTVKAFVFDKVFDIDHVKDIEKANKWLNS